MTWDAYTSMLVREHLPHFVTRIIIKWHSKEVLHKVTLKSPEKVELTWAGPALFTTSDPQAIEPRAPSPRPSFLSKKLGSATGTTIKSNVTFCKFYLRFFCDFENGQEKSKLSQVACYCTCIIKVCITIKLNFIDVWLLGSLDGT